MAWSFPSHPSGSSSTRVTRSAGVALGEASEDRRGLVGRAIIDDHDLERWVSAGELRRERGFDVEPLRRAPGR
jgi:hypothetical protein